jgi:hypothetical protein
MNSTQSNRKSLRTYSWGRATPICGFITAIAVSVLACLAGSINASAVTLAWAPSSGAEGIQIERSTPDASDFVQIAQIDGSATSFTDGGMTCGVTYFYRVRAYNSAGESPYSNVAGPTIEACCGFGITPTNVAMPLDGGYNSVAVTASNTCSWTAISNVGWISIPEGYGNGTGDGTVDYAVAANTGTSTLTGTVTIAEQTFTVIEAGAPTGLVGITNSVDTVGGIPIVIAGESIGFNAGTVNNNGSPLTYAWNFGDGGTSTDSAPDHVFADCGPYTVSLAVSDGVTTTNANLKVSVPCLLAVTNFSAALRFTRPNQDECTFRAVPQPGQCTNWLGTTVTLNVGGAQVSLTLDARGRGVSTNASCSFSYNKRTGECEMTARLSRGTWRGVWASYGLVNSDTPRSGVSVTLPVTLMINDESFMADKPLHYSAVVNRSGEAR